MIQIYADGSLIYDSRLRLPGKDYSLLGLTTTKAENKGGTANIVMPPWHPAYNALIAHRSIVEMYRDNVLRFRGRALYPTDDFYNRRTWLVEGELCLFQDGTHRPYLYQDTPEAIFRAVVEDYNSQVEEYKRFRVGDITVTDANNYVRLESEKAEQSLAVLNKLVERCGGKIIFTTGDDGTRVINWYANPGLRSSQTIEFGSNLLDFARDGANTDFATVIIPYGAMDQETGKRVTIESVNDGNDYLVDEEAKALRGYISRPVYWDDVTEPENLLRKAREWLEEHRYIITTLTLTALDLSRLTKPPKQADIAVAGLAVAGLAVVGTDTVSDIIDSFQEGDAIHVRSKPHAVDEDFRLTEITENWLVPDASTIKLGKSTLSLTGADVAGDDHSLSELQKTTNIIKADYKLNINNAVAETERLLRSLIQQTSESIRMEVAAEYTTNDKLISAISSSMTQLADSFTYEFSQLQAVVDENGALVEGRFTEIYSYIRMKGGTLSFGSSENGITLTLENDLIVFKKNGVRFGWWDGVDFHTGNIVVEVNERAQFGNFAAIPRSNGALSWLKVK